MGRVQRKRGLRVAPSKQGCLTSSRMDIGEYGHTDVFVSGNTYVFVARHASGPGRRISDTLHSRILPLLSTTMM